MTIAEVLALARSRLDRVRPEDLDMAIANGALVVDIRDSVQRMTRGDVPGSHVIDLTVLEWRLAPSSDTRSFDIDADRQVILICSQGYSSSLAAARLQDLGLHGATDLVGGYEAWKAHLQEANTQIDD